MKQVITALGFITLVLTSTSAMAQTIETTHSDSQSKISSELSVTYDCYVYPDGSKWCRSY